MLLSDYLNYDHIYIQCHDNPDADTLASGFALYTYYKEHNIDAHLFYSGRFTIQKSNLLLMIEKLSIPIEYIEKDSMEFHDELLITVDCQYGNGNVTLFLADHVVVIDHHKEELVLPKDSLIISNFGSCSTIIWLMFSEIGVDLGNYPDVSTALYYGLLTDTLQFTEIHYPADKDMRDSLYYNKSTISQLRNSNLSASELEIAGIAMIRTIYNEVNRYSLIRSEPCDPNILGLISDMCIQVDNVDKCVVYNELTDGIKYSVRSCVRDTKASDLAAFLADGIGSGGGHMEKAGGFISRTKYNAQHPGIHTEAYFSERIQLYCESFDIIDASTYEMDTTDMKRYKKKKLPIGYVVATDILPIGTPITIRTLEGDMEATISNDMYLMIGIQGEVYTNSREKFNRSYRISDEPYNLNVSYKPTVKSRLDGKIISLAQYVHTCIPSGDVFIMAKPIEKAVKVFTKWYEDSYMLGNIGDYIAVRGDDTHDIYVIEGNIFKITYEEIS